MKQVPDRKKLRREYLWKKRRPLAGIVMMLVFWTIMLTVEYRHGSVNPGMWVIFGSFFLSQIAVQSYYLAKAVKVAREVPYVPPVTPDTLPADEILVRGSEEPPVAQSEVLLRAAKGKSRSDLDSMEELLRVSQE